MQPTSPKLLGAILTTLLFSGVALAQSQDPSGQAPTDQQPTINTPPQQQPAAPPPDKTKPQPGQQAPVASPDTVTPKNSKEDVEAIGNRSVGKGINFYSIEHEIGLGKQLAQEVERSAKLIDDPVVTEYVNRVGQNLVHNSDAKVPFTIKVIDSDEVNAFALPGGFFYVNSGLILRANEESELAGVMAHEIAHVAARHGTKQATKGDLIQIASIPAMIMLPYGWAGYGIYQGMNFLIPMTFLKFSRDAEREADFLGLLSAFRLTKNAAPAPLARRSPLTRPRRIASRTPKKRLLAFFPRGKNISSLLRNSIPSRPACAASCSPAKPSTTLPENRLFAPAPNKPTRIKHKRKPIPALTTIAQL